MSTIQTRAIVTLQARIDTLLARATASGDADLADALETASAALEYVLQNR